MIAMGLWNTRSLIYIAMIAIPSVVYANHQWAHERKAPWGYAGVARGHQEHHHTGSRPYSILPGGFVMDDLLRD
jgi:hypothetical protein